MKHVDSCCTGETGSLWTNANLLSDMKLSDVRSLEVRRIQTNLLKVATSLQCPFSA